MTVLLDYGSGNLRSVQRALADLGHGCRVQGDLRGATRLILPGVGAFGPAMARLAPLASDIRAFAASGAPLLGVCLGLQLLFEASEELGAHEGLGIVPGRVRYLPRAPGLKVPHMGWNELELAWLGALGPEVSDGDQVYFVHSLYAECADTDWVAAWCRHGARFPAALRRGNVWATQFHPEKSGAVGLRVLCAFLSA
jgi:glutamine amidotransferase